MSFSIVYCLNKSKHPFQFAYTSSHILYFIENCTIWLSTLVLPSAPKKPTFGQTNRNISVHPAGPHTHTGLTAHTHAHTRRHTNTNRTEIHVKSKLGSTSNLLHIAGRIAPTFRHYYLYKTNFHHREVGRHLSRPTLHSPDLGRWCAAGSLFWQSLPPHSIALPEVEAAAAAEKSPNRFLFSMH